MTSLIFKTASHFLLVITLLFSIWVLFRGHNAPGGGFIGGLIAASGFALYILAHGANALRELVKFKVQSLLSLGLAVVMLSGLIALVSDKIFLTGAWVELKIIGLDLGSPVLFDIGVYLVVLSSVLIIILALEESV